MTLHAIGYWVGSLFLIVSAVHEVVLCPSAALAHHLWVSRTAIVFQSIVASCLCYYAVTGQCQHSTKETDNTNLLKFSPKPQIYWNPQCHQNSVRDQVQHWNLTAETVYLGNLAQLNTLLSSNWNSSSPCPRSSIVGLTSVEFHRKRAIQGTSTLLLFPYPVFSVSFLNPNCCYLQGSLL